MTNFFSYELVVILISELESFISPRSHHERVINGYDAPNRDFYVRTVFHDPVINKTEKFGGVIISENYVLSAAHIFNRS